MATMASETPMSETTSSAVSSPAGSKTAGQPAAAPLSYRVLGAPVHAVQIPEVVELMEGWIRDREAGKFIAVTGMHGVSESVRDPEFRRILDAASLVVPDGMPLVWLGRSQGYDKMKRRVYGPEMMETFCRQTADRYRHFLYGGAEGVPEQLADVLRQRFGVRVVGMYSPPFRPLTEEEKTGVIERIREAEPDILWVGLSTPKQERWMYEYRDRLNVPVLVGVGAAFDFHTGRVKQAPRWMQENGLEWLFRLISEPKRLWRRYLIQGSGFAWNVALEKLGLKRFS
jgi:N-acetylglucosaminyldiphosphoundecaprenol N-acetyl-beta-D-mannosaminyltransferase